MTNPSPAPPADDESLLCPFCGYDLRATLSDRCSECGHPIDRAALQTSSIPWAHRRELGSLRAYLKTLWQITLNSSSLACEAAKPQDLHAARIFRRLTALILCAIFLGGFVAILFTNKGLASFAIQPYPAFRAATPGWAQDLLVPWSAGATLLPTLPLLLIVLAFYLTGSQAVLFRLPDASPTRQERLTAIALYTAAPLAWLLPAAVFQALALGLVIPFNTPLTASLLALFCIAWAFFAMALLGFAIRTAQWAARVRHAGVGYACLALAKLVGLWLLGPLVLLAVLPWCIGFLWIVIDSFR